MPEHQKEIEVRVRDEVNDAIGEAVQTELKPVVREAITEDVLRAVQDLVGLTPAVVAAITEDLASEDSTIRQRAYSLVAKYTIGHPAIVRAEDQHAGQQLVVIQGLPRPEERAPLTAEGSPPMEPAKDVIELAEGAAIETKICDKCGNDKPLEEFVAASDRCTTCFQEQQRRAQEMIASGPDD